MLRAICLAGLEDVLDTDAGLLGELGCAGWNATGGGELSIEPLDAEGEVLKVAGHVQRPAVVAE